MGISSDAILAYGYDLGGDDSGWKIEGLDEDGMPEFDWYDYDRESFDGVMLRRLARLNGMLVEPGDYVDETELKSRSGVEFVMYQHADCPAYILTVKYVEVHRGHSERIESLDVPEGADEKLRAAVNAIGIEPKGEPGWWLVSYMG